MPVLVVKFALNTFCIITPPSAAKFPLPVLDSESSLVPPGSVLGDSHLLGLARGASELLNVWYFLGSNYHLNQTIGP